MKPEDEYLTKDLYEAALLYTCQLRLSRLDRDGPCFWFVFQNRPECERLIKNFWNKEANIDAKGFADSIRSLKDKMFNLSRKNEYGNGKIVATRHIHENS